MGLEQKTVELVCQRSLLTLPRQLTYFAISAYLLCKDSLLTFTTDFSFGLSPFIDAKIGYSVLDASGFYINPGVGVSWNFYKKGLSAFLKVGYTYNANSYDGWMKPNEMGWVSVENKTDIYPHGVYVSIGFGF